MIHHYTSISNLALILSTKSIRFNRLDLVDDIAETKDLPFSNLSTHYFVSCWTKAAKENIALWKMYTNFLGVKISFHQTPFLLHKIDKQFSGGAVYKSPFRKEDDLIRDGENTYFYLPTNAEFGLYDVSYVDETLLESKKKSAFLEETVLDRTTIDHDLIALTKKDYWKFQEESRYVIILYPIHENKAGDTVIGSDKIIKSRPLGRQFFDVELNDNCINNIEVTLSPCASAADRVIVEALVSKLTSNGKIRSSRLEGDIRIK